MRYIKGNIDFWLEGPCAVSLGKFDGLHRGHQLLLSRIGQRQAAGMTSVIFTFDFGGAKGLMLSQERRRMLESQGVDVLLECPFVPELSHMEPEAFVRKILKERLQAAYLAVGTDFHFGYQRRGDYHLLQQMAGECGYTVEVVEKAQYGGRDISSTFIREELEKGNIEQVNALLGYPYNVTGEVVHGRAVGRTLGTPTINLVPEERKLLPPNGVYATRTLVDGEWYEGITNIGSKPTVGGGPIRGVETYLFGVDKDLYGKEVTVFFHSFERPERRFGSLEELKGQLRQDADWGQQWFRENASCQSGEFILK
ncbi:MAG: bifunctional riboflavin kinase/FAD synthetase [Lachnospiraceae bacterium]|nr:bifunctional riboflavin kinase/FAD synthetase [Lachnospiraceae bacterium]